MGVLKKKKSYLLQFSGIFTKNNSNEREKKKPS